MKGVLCILSVLLAGAMALTDGDLVLHRERVMMSLMGRCTGDVCPPMEFPNLTCIDHPVMDLDIHCVRYKAATWRAMMSKWPDHPYAAWFNSVPYCDDEVAQLRARLTKGWYMLQADVLRCIRESVLSIYTTVGSAVRSRCLWTCPRFHSGVRNVTLLGVDMEHHFGVDLR